MKSSIGSASLSFFRVAGLGRCVAFLLLSGLVFLPLTAEAGLPRAAISIKGGWDFSYCGGNQMDRFSLYFPSLFSLRCVLHGIPSGTDLFDAITSGSVHYGFSVMDFIRIDGMYSYAPARNLQESSHFRKFDGLELSFNTPGPKGALVQGTVS